MDSSLDAVAVIFTKKAGRAGKLKKPDWLLKTESTFLFLPFRGSGALFFFKALQAVYRAPLYLKKDGGKRKSEV